MSDSKKVADVSAPAEKSETPAECLERLRNARRDRELAREQAQMLSDVAREQLQAKADAEFERREVEYGNERLRLVVVEADGFVIVKVPPPQNYRKFLDSGEPHNTDNQLSLIKPCVVHSEPAWDKLVALRPAVITMTANACVELAGVRAASTASKS